MGLEKLPLEINQSEQTVQKMFCLWGIHRHNKTIILRSEEVGLEFSINICPRCKCPSKKTMKQIFGNGEYRITEDLYCIVKSLLSEINYNDLWRMIRNEEADMVRRLEEKAKTIERLLKN